MLHKCVMETTPRVVAERMDTATHVLMVKRACLEQVTNLTQEEQSHSTVNQVIHVKQRPTRSGDWARYIQGTNHVLLALTTKQLV